MIAKIIHKSLQEVIFKDMYLDVGLIFIEVANFVNVFEDFIKLDLIFLYSIAIWNIGIIKIVSEDGIHFK